tara:strand:+ start:869 stop:1273 length:405 start_codon:yes stop_codon:yes gene_type:complete
MEFKVNLALFKSTEDSLKARYKEKYDPSKKYPQYSGNMQLTEMDIIKMVTYLQKAKPEATDYNPEGVVTVRAVGYINTSKNGLQYLSINLEPDYKTLKAIEEAEMSGGATTPTSTSTSTPTPIANKVEEDFIPF